MNLITPSLSFSFLSMPALTFGNETKNDIVFTLFALFFKEISFYEVYLIKINIKTKDKLLKK